MQTEYLVHVGQLNITLLWLATEDITVYGFKCLGDIPVISVEPNEKVLDGDEYCGCRIVHK